MYFIECREKNQYFSRVHEMKYIWYLPKKSKFSSLYSTENFRKYNLIFFLVVSCST